jgi:hypothetical protein
VDASEIEARASDGEVTLERSVTNHAQKRIAEQDARDVVGVAWVTNHLFVKTDQPEDWPIRSSTAASPELRPAIASVPRLSSSVLNPFPDSNTTGPSRRTLLPTGGQFSHRCGP